MMPKTRHLTYLGHFYHPSRHPARCVICPASFVVWVLIRRHGRAGLSESRVI
jgi:hypothetical protein